jgi:predicted ribosomally synthesized peptide with SipW-like signal peptide
MNKTKKSLLMSAISLLLCISMLIGSTFAWFTDSVTSAGNKIQSGTLKVDLELLDKETGKWNSLKDTKAPIFNYDKWEPGYVDTKVLKVENEGNLALKWVAKFYSEYQLSILADVIDVYVRPSDSEICYPTDRNLEGYTCVAI